MQKSLSKPLPLSGAQKLLMVGQLFDFAIKTKMQFFRKKYPHESEADLKQRALESIERGTR